jgi:hypothetical protein
MIPQRLSPGLTMLAFSGQWQTDPSKSSLSQDHPILNAKIQRATNSEVI